MKKSDISTVNYLFLLSLGLSLILGMWFIVSYFEWISSLFLPAPMDVLHAIYSGVQSGVLLSDVGMSLLRILIGMVISIIIALPCGIAIGVSRRFEALFEPMIAFLRYIPPSAFIPLAIIWLGIGEVEKIIIIFLGVAPYLTLLIADFVSNTRNELIDVALTLGASKYQLIRYVIIPNILPGVWDALRIMFGAAWTYVIIAEIVGANSGIGHMMMESERFLRTDQVFGGVIVIGVLGLATDYFFKLTYQLFFPWMEKSHA